MDITQLLTTARTAAVNVERIITKAEVKERFDIVNEGISLLERTFLELADTKFKLNDLIDKKALQLISTIQFKEVKIHLMNAIDVMMLFSEQHRYFRNHNLRPSVQ